MVKSSKVPFDFKTIVRAQIRLLQKFETKDSKRLVAKISDPGDVRLIQDAESLLKSEGTLVPYAKVDVPRIKAELAMLCEIQVTRGDIIDWAREVQDYLKTLSWKRIDWLWDFSWSYILWDSEAFDDRDVLIYGAIRGNPPIPSKNVPYQAAINWERKRRTKALQKDIFKLAKSGSYEELVSLGLTPSQAQHAITKVESAR